MTTICFGGVCVPVNAIWPLVLFALKWLYEKVTTLGARPAGTIELDDRPDAALPAVPPVDSTEAWERRVAATKASGRVLVVDFTATWCKPCQKVAPFFARLAATYAGADFVKVDVDTLDDVAEAAGVAAMPTFQAYAGGELAGSMSGANEGKLRSFVESHCGGGLKTA